MDQHSLRYLDIAEVFGDLGGIVHRAADETNFAPMLARHVNRQLDAVNRRRETRNKETPLGTNKYLFKLAMNRALTGRVALALNVSRILQESQHSLFAVLRKTVQIKQSVVSGSRVDFEVARMQHHA